MSVPQPSAELLISAPIHRVWSVITDTASYGEWAGFIEGFEAPRRLSAGDRIVLHVRWDNGSTARSVEEVTAVDEPSAGQARLDYAYRGWPSRLGLVRTRRFQTLTSEDAGQTRYRTWMALDGPLARFAGPDRIERGFVVQAEGLKRRCEG